MKAILKFDNVILNRRGGYDPKTGIFTAPITGLYQISVTLLNLLGPPLHGSTETANPVLELKAGDKVYVRNNISSSSRVHGDSHSYISGYFISE